ncbi:MAG: murA [Candidatus Midichloriaceae bacterium]|jgi:UDP-N-acetylglucosamine 1-carboxyvinyltransferase|nr:murA [Candidatus Midichloriaceae bacterium]
MDKLKINGGTPLIGEIPVSGSKNASLPIIAACILATEKVLLSNVPNLADIHSMKDLLIDMGADISFSPKTGSFEHTMSINCANLNKLVADYEIVRKMRASVLVLGPMLTRFKEARVSLPGGCAIGTRPVDMHLSALELMGAEIELEHGYIIAKAPSGLNGAEIFFDKISVGATENILMAATLAKGKTTIHNAAREPEVVDLCEFLIKLGAKIEGIGTDTLVITGVSALSGTEHKMIPDRIEAGTFAILAAATNGKLTIKNCTPKHLSSLTHHLRTAGIAIEESETQMVVYRENYHISPANVQTAPYPNFPTDLQAQFMTMLTLANGVSHLTETIFENRFMHVNELIRLGADISINDNIAIITGVEKLKAADVMSSDLRASASLVIAALCAEGESVIHRIYHLDRGYENIEHKLSAVGAQITRFSS